MTDNTMKQLYTLAITLLVLAGCTGVKNKALFPESPSERTASAVAELRRFLTDAPEGWIMEYTPDENQSFGGFLMHVRFQKSGEVIVNSELQKQDAPATSGLYSIQSDKGTVLSFDTYNPTFHYFADPDINDGHGRGKGFLGDWSMVVLSQSADRITLRGKMSDNIITLHRPKEGVDAYYAKARALKAEAFDLDYYFLTTHQDAWTGTIGGKKVVLYYNLDGFNVFDVEIEGEYDRVQAPYVITDTGLRFLTPLLKVTELTWNATDKSWKLPSGDALTLREDPVYKSYAKYLGKYMLQYIDFRARKVVQAPVELEMAPRNQYLVKGLPYDITLTYLPESDAILLAPQAIVAGGKQYVLVALDSEGHIGQASDIGLVTAPVPNSEGVYKFEDNGKWGKEIWAFAAIDLSSVSIAPITPALFSLKTLSKLPD